MNLDPDVKPVHVEVDGTISEFAKKVVSEVIKLLEDTETEDVRMVIPGDPTEKEMFDMYEAFTSGEAGSMLEQSKLKVEAGSPDPDRETPNGFRFSHAEERVLH